MTDHPPSVQVDQPAALPPTGRPAVPGLAFLTILFRLIAIVAFAIGMIEIGAGIMFGEPRAVLGGSCAAAFAVFVGWRVRGVGDHRTEGVVTSLAMALLGLMAVASGLQPSLGPALAVGSLVPAVLAIPFVASRLLLRILVLSGLTGIWSVIAGLLVPPSALPEQGQAVIAFVVMVAAYGFLVASVWAVSRRLKDTTAGLQSIVAMSADLAQTLDPRLVGDRIAIHVARAIGADDCALSYWDRPRNRVVTLGYHPVERRVALSDSYAVDEYPATRAVLNDQRPVMIDVADPRADAQEVGYLRSIGHSSMAMIPLIAAGRTVGLIEVTAARSGTFSARSVEVATMLAAEAAMALENARLYDEIRHQALHDGLTGLANRVLFRDRVAHAVARNRRNGGRAAVLFIDLDDFKNVNDTHGHDRGDEVLAVAAERVTDVLRPSDTAARYGGDEFAVLVEDVADADDALTVATRLAEALRQPMSIGPSVVRIAASIGVAIGVAGAEEADDLLRDADVAMYAAKASSRGGVELFRPSLRDGAVERAARSANLRGLEDRGELRLDYQPIVDIVTGQIEGAEALVRWQPPEGPVLMPGDWIELAEETGDVFPIGRWVLREACRQARDWQIRLARPDLRISVNLSARQFLEHDVVGTVRAALDDSGLPPETLILEITESGLMRQTATTIDRLGALRSLGVHLAIDDFGTGYSSLSYLERFPIDILKIDRSFVSSTPNQLSPIAAAILDLGRTLGLQVIAEGIEEPEQARRLAELGCRLGQGYLYARPMGATAIESLLAEGDGLDRPVEPESGIDSGLDDVRDDGPRLRVVAGGG
ncbi:MAG: EAL domain-containing protein [Chloroflexi bacterium]|nr:EAL domain-containing protein [Chloroflexota bacterium]